MAKTFNDKIIEKVRGACSPEELREIPIEEMRYQRIVCEDLGSNHYYLTTSGISNFSKGSEYHWRYNSGSDVIHFSKKVPGLKEHQYIAGMGLRSDSAKPMSNLLKHRLQGLINSYRDRVEKSNLERVKEEDSILELIDEIIADAESEGIPSYIQFKLDMLKERIERYE